MSKWRAVSTSIDGHINMVDIFQGKTQKSFFVDKSGIVGSTPLAQEDSYAVALANNSVGLFSFKTGTTITQFNAHDDSIGKILFRNQYLFTCSVDQTMKLWDLQSGNFN
jgi:WD40 repeat protein